MHFFVQKLMTSPNFNELLDSTGCAIVLNRYHPAAFTARIGFCETIFKIWYTARTHSRRCLSVAAEAQFHQKDNWSSRNNDQRLEDMYIISGEELGRGHFGVVNTCYSKSTGQAFACKTVLKEKLEVSFESVFVRRTKRIAHIGNTSRFFRSCSII